MKGFHIFDSQKYDGCEVSTSLPCFWIGPYVSCLSPSRFFELHLPYFDPVLLILFWVEPSVFLLSRSISFNWDYFYSIVTQSFQFIQPVLPFFDSEFIQSLLFFFCCCFFLFCFVFFYSDMVFPFIESVLPFFKSDFRLWLRHSRVFWIGHFLFWLSILPFI